MQAAMLDNLGALATTAIHDPTAEPTVPLARSARACLQLVLDEIDYGIVLVAGTHRVVYANHAARQQVSADASPLALDEGILRARRGQEAARLHDAIVAARRRGVRQMLNFECKCGEFALAVLPLPHDGDPEAALTLVVIARSQVCEALSVRGFANCLGLTPAEREVLLLLAASREPIEIAQEQCVALSTVRTHLSKIRQKAGVSSLRDLMGLLARLPPLRVALRA